MDRKRLALFDQSSRRTCSTKSLVTMLWLNVDIQDRVSKLLKFLLIFTCYWASIKWGWWFIFTTMNTLKRGTINYKQPFNLFAVSKVGQCHLNEIFPRFHFNINSLRRKSFYQISRASINYDSKMLWLFRFQSHFV